MERLTFLKTFLAHPSTVGSLIPSSFALGKVMVDNACVSESDVIVEFGAGTGIFTKVIEDSRRDNSQFFAFEIEEKFANLTRKRCPDVEVLNKCATTTPELLHSRGLQGCDCIVSGLPWASLPKNIHEQLFEAMYDSLKPGGIFVTFGYIQSVFMPSMTRFRRKLDARFERTGVSPWVWRNFPPARAYWAKKAKRPELPG